MLIPVVAAAFCASAETGRDDCVTYFSCGFESGMPSLTAVYDEDGRELHFTMVRSGFESRDSWRCLREEGQRTILLPRLHVSRLWTASLPARRLTGWCCRRYGYAAGMRPSIGRAARSTISQAVQARTTSMCPRPSGTFFFHSASGGSDKRRRDG